MILSLAMIKKKRYSANVIDTKYQRHKKWPIKTNKWKIFIGLFEREVEKLNDAIYKMENLGDIGVENLARGIEVPELYKMMSDKVYDVMLELADFSNTLDFLFEVLLFEYHNLEKNKNVS